MVGKRLPRLAAGAMATGAAKYTTDIKLPGMLIGKVLRSPYPHARILKIDKSKAEKLPGVETVISFEDVPKKPFNMSMQDLMSPDPVAAGLKRDQYIFNDKARYFGDAVVAVAAITESIAEEALELIEVEYEKLPAVFDPVEAMKPGAPAIHDFARDNIVWHQPFPAPIGDVEKGFQEADYIVEETFRTSRQKHCQLEPSACVASFDTNGRLTVWSPGQDAFCDRAKVADIFDIPEGMIRWLTPHVGGAFGNGSSVRAEPICITLAEKTGKPVKLEYTREEEFITTETRHQFIQAVKMGVKKDGTITALQAKLIANAGAYFARSNAVTVVSMGHIVGLYRCLNQAAEANIVYTNVVAAGAFRGYGNPQAMWVLEQLVDMACEKIGMDPLEFRLKNHVRTGDPGVGGLPIENCALDDCIKAGAERIGWKEKRGRKKEGVVKRRGVGMAIMMHVSGTHPHNLEHSNAFIKLNEDGSANLAVSACDMGQNILGTLAQIAAEELGLSAEDIHIVSGDTDTTMFDAGQHASRSLYVIGNAVQRAAAEAKGQLLERAAKNLEVSADELEVKLGRVYVKAALGKGVSVAEVVRDAIYNYQGECLNISGKCSWEPGQSPQYNAIFTEVEVDAETGEVKLLKLVVVQDSGQVINPTIVEGQLEGGIMQGIGYGLTEDFVINKDTGVLESDNFTTYKIPSALDTPDIEVILVEQPVPSGPFGAKGVGEAGINAVAPAIANAIYDAVGVRIKELPITPEKVLKGLESKK